MLIEVSKITSLIDDDGITLDELCDKLNISSDDALENIKSLVKKKIVTLNNNLIELNSNNLESLKTKVLKAIKEDNIFNCYYIERLSSNKKALFAVLDDLQRNRVIKYFKGYNAYSYLIKVKVVTKNDTYAFCHSDEYDKDYYIPEYEAAGIYVGDELIVYPIEFFGKLLTVAVEQVLSHAINQMVGTFIVTKRKKRKTKEIYETYSINSAMKSFPVSAYVAKADISNAKSGDVVFADIAYTATGIRAYVKEVLGHKDDPGIEIAEIALEYGFRAEFPIEVIDETSRIPDYVLPNEYEGRKDFRKNSAITIDGDSSKDFDDAVYVKKLNNGNYILDVYIADVSHYVKEDAPLDKEALSRGTSVYLADRVIPMLPHKLSNGICSLNEGVDRLVMACSMEIDNKGNLVNYDITEGVINSCHRMTYGNVNKMINGDDELLKKYSDIKNMIFTMKELSEIIRLRRYKRGGIEFDTKEYEFKLSCAGRPIAIIERERFDAEKMIEDFMLSANETVAYHMSILHLPSMFRVHEKPDQEKLHQVFQSISTMVPVKLVQNDIHPKQIQELLESIKDNPNYFIMNNMLLRSMMKAKYSSECLGHYGLAMQYYCHFTSPIRRYPDLITHRMIKKLLLHPVDLNHDIDKYNKLLPEIALRNSLSERKAIDCERAVDDMLFAWYMEKRIRERYEGIIDSITNFGMFVSLDNGVEGLISYRNMNGYFEFNENNSTASNGKKVYHLGDRVSIIVVGADRKNRKIDFMLTTDYDSRRYDDYEYEDSLYK